MYNITYCVLDNRQFNADYHNWNDESRLCVVDKRLDKIVRKNLHKKLHLINWQSTADYFVYNNKIYDKTFIYTGKEYSNETVIVPLLYGWGDYTENLLNFIADNKKFLRQDNVIIVMIIHQIIFIIILVH